MDSDEFYPENYRFQNSVGKINTIFYETKPKISNLDFKLTNVYEVDKGILKNYLFQISSFLL